MDPTSLLLGSHILVSIAIIMTHWYPHLFPGEEEYFKRGLPSQEQLICSGYNTGPFNVESNIVTIRP